MTLSCLLPYVLMSLLTVLWVPLTLVPSPLVLGMAASPAEGCPREQSKALDILGRPSLQQKLIRAREHKTGRMQLDDQVE